MLLAEHALLLAGEDARGRDGRDPHPVAEEENDVFRTAAVGLDRGIALHGGPAAREERLLRLGRARRGRRERTVGGERQQKGGKHASEYIRLQLRAGDTRWETT